MFYSADGRPDPNGRFQLIDGVLKLRTNYVLRNGEHVSADVMFMDSAKSDPPKSIDEALRQRFAEMAKQRDTDVKEMLTTLQQTEIEKIAAEVATAFVSASAGEGVAAQFGDAAPLNDAETGYIIARARQAHDSRYGYLPEGQRPAFTADQAATAVADELKAKVRQRAGQMVLAADQASDPSFRHGMDTALRVTRKHAIANAWRR